MIFPSQCHPAIGVSAWPMETSIWTPLRIAKGHCVLQVRDFRARGDRILDHALLSHSGPPKLGAVKWWFHGDLNAETHHIKCIECYR